MEFFSDILKQLLNAEMRRSSCHKIRIAGTVCAFVFQLSHQKISKISNKNEKKQNKIRRLHIY